jgi:hypothetical protein
MVAVLLELVVSCRALNCTLPFLSSLYCPAWLLALLQQAEEAAGERKDDGYLSSGSEDEDAEDEDEEDEDEEEEEEGDPAAAAADALVSLRARLQAAAAAGRHRKQQPQQQQQQQQQQQRTARRKRVVAPALMPEQPGGQRVSSRQQVPNRKFMD